MSWQEVDSATTSPTQTDIPFGPIGTVTSFQGRVVVMLDNLPSTHPHYSLIPKYCNEAKDELLTLGLGIGREVLDQLMRLRNWRWWTTTLDSVNLYALPERMLYLEAMSYTKSTAAYSDATTVLYPSNPVAPGSAQDFGLYSRTAVGYPILWRRAGSSIEVWPTPYATPTDYRTTMVVYGTRMDKDLSADTDTLLMSPRMQLLAVDLAVAVSMDKMGWEEAGERRTAVLSKLSSLILGGAKERIAARTRTRAAGTPA